MRPPAAARDPDGLLKDAEAYASDPGDACIGAPSGPAFYIDGAYAGAIGGCGSAGIGASFLNQLEEYTRNVTIAALRLHQLAAQLVLTGSVSIDFGGGPITFAFNAGVSGFHRANVSLEALVDVFVAAHLTRGITSLEFSSGWRPEDPRGGTRNLEGDGRTVHTHDLGRGVDIWMVNRHTVLNHPDWRLLYRFMGNLMGGPFAAEVYGPYFAWNRPSPEAGWRFAGWGTVDSHMNHIHYSTYAPWS
jgi:hypothetical protein